MEFAIVAAVAIIGYLLIRATSPATTSTGAVNTSALGGSSALPVVSGALSGVEAFLSSLSSPTSQASINKSLSIAPQKSSGSVVYGPVAPVSVSAPQFSNANLGANQSPLPGLTAGTVNPLTGLGVDTIAANLAPPTASGSSFPPTPQGTFLDTSDISGGTTPAFSMLGDDLDFSNYGLPV